MTDESWRGEEAELPEGLRAFFGLQRPPTPEERQSLEARYRTLVELGNARWEEVPAYNRSARCGKCGSRAIAVAHHPAPDPERGHPTSCLERVGAHEHLIRQCRGCGYVWWERPLERAPIGLFQRILGRLSGFSRSGVA